MTDEQRALVRAYWRKNQNAYRARLRTYNPELLRKMGREQKRRYRARKRAVAAPREPEQLSLWQENDAKLQDVTPARDALAQKDA